MPDALDAKVHTADGTPLAAATFGDAATARAGVLIVPAMGVDQRYYAPSRPGSRRTERVEQAGQREREGDVVVSSPKPK